jgi:hypothetical protein
MGTAEDGRCAFVCEALPSSCHAGFSSSCSPSRRSSLRVTFTVMPSLDHESLVLLFHNHPELAAELLRAGTWK